MKDETDIQLINTLFLAAGFDVSSEKTPVHCSGISLHYRRNRDGSFRSFWPIDAIEASSLAFSGASAGKTWLSHKFLCLLSKAGLDYAYSHGRITLYASAESREAIQSRWGTNYALFNTGLGRHRPGATWSCKQESGVFTKIALDAKAEADLSREKAALQQISRLGLWHFSYPEVTASTTKSLSLTDPYRPHDRADASLLPQHAYALTELGKRTLSFTVVKKLEALTKATSILTTLASSDHPRLPASLINKLLYLKSTLPLERSIPCSLSHGDFSPYNILLDNDRIKLYNWQHASVAAPLLTDAFHFLFQSGMLLKQQSAAEILQAIGQLTKERWVIDLVASGKAEISLQLRLYLIVNCAFYIDSCMQEEGVNAQAQKQLKIWSDLVGILLSEQKVLNQRQLLTMDLFAHMRGRQYAALGWEEEFPEDLSLLADLEFCIEKKDLEGIERFLFAHPFVYHADRQPLSCMQSYTLATTDGLQLTVRFIWKFRRNALQLLDAAALLSSAVNTKEGIRLPALEMEFEYSWISYLLHGLSMPERLQHKYMQLPEVKRESLNDFFRERWQGTGLLHYVFALDHSDELTTAIKRCLRSREYNRGFTKLHNTLAYLLDLLPGLFINRASALVNAGAEASGAQGDENARRQQQKNKVSMGRQRRRVLFFFGQKSSLRMNVLQRRIGR